MASLLPSGDTTIANARSLNRRTWFAIRVIRALDFAILLETHAIRVMKYKVTFESLFNLNVNVRNLKLVIDYLTRLHISHKHECLFKIQNDLH